MFEPRAAVRIQLAGCVRFKAMPQNDLTAADQVSIQVTEERDPGHLRPMPVPVESACTEDSLKVLRRK